MKAEAHDRINVLNNPVNLIDPYGLESFDKGSYTFKKFIGDLMHGGEHWHVYKRKGGKLLGRVGMQGQVLTGSVPKRALKILVNAGKIGGAVVGVILELSTPANAGDVSDYKLIPLIPLPPHEDLPLPLIPEDDSPC